jgi:hypothetical protein
MCEGKALLTPSDAQTLGSSMRLLSNRGAFVIKR